MPMKTASRSDPISLGLAAGVLALGVAFLAVTGASQPEPPLATASPDTLAAVGLHLSDPGVQAPVPISQTAANETAIRGQGPGTSVRESVLAHVTSTPGSAQVDCVCWVVSVMPPGGIWSNPPSGGQPQRGTYDIRLIDAMTGQFVLGVEGSPMR